MHALAIDIPIGLTTSGPRDCDLQARKALGKRRSSVFPAPLRAMLRARTYREACNIRYEIERKKISKQTWGIMRKIVEVDAALRRDRSRQDWVHEVHPERCFMAWNGGEPMAHNKKTKDGRAERRTLVESHFGPDAFTSVRSQFLKKVAADDDILDAFAALWTAERIVAGRALTLPYPPPLDSEGLRMEMVY